MFKSLQATIFCFAAVILAIVLISSYCTDSKKTEAMSQQVQSLQEQGKAQTEELDKCRQELEASKTENGLLSEEIKQEKAKSEKTGRKLLEVVGKLENAQKRLEANAKTLTELQNQLAVSRQLASNAAKPEEIKKLQQEITDLKAQIANMETERTIVLNNARINAQKCIAAENKLKAARIR